jgi:hypothetical protein
MALQSVPPTSILPPTIPAGSGGNSHKDNKSGFPKLLDRRCRLCQKLTADDPNAVEKINRSRGLRLEVRKLDPRRMVVLRRVGNPLSAIAMRACDRTLVTA